MEAFVAIIERTLALFVGDTLCTLQYLFLYLVDVRLFGEGFLVVLESCSGSFCFSGLEFMEVVLGEEDRGCKD